MSGCFTYQTNEGGRWLVAQMSTHEHTNAPLKSVVLSIKMSICLCHIKKPAEKELPKSKVDVYVRVFDGECPLTHACATYLLIMRS